MQITYNNVTNKEDFMFEIGLNLEAELATTLTGDLGNVELECDCFIHQAEEFLLNYYSVYFGFNGDLKYQNQIDNFKKAVVYQVQFWLEHPDVRRSIENSINLPKALLRDLGVDSTAETYMRKGGFANV